MSEVDSLKARVRELEAQVAELSKENQSLKKVNERLESSMTALMAKFAARSAEAPPTIHAPSAAAATANSSGSGLALKSPRDKTSTLAIKTKRRSGLPGSNTWKGPMPRSVESVQQQSESDSGFGRRRSTTVDMTTLPIVPQREASASNVHSRNSQSSLSASPRDESDHLSLKAWGVALRDHFANGVTVPSAVSQLISYLKQAILDDEKSGRVLFKAGVTEDQRLRGLVEFGDSVPSGTAVEVVAKCLISYLESLPEPVIVPEAALLLVEAQGMDVGDYKRLAIKSVMQHSLPYNHRVLLQLLVSLLARMRDSGADMDNAIDALSAALFPKPPFSMAPTTPRDVLSLLAQEGMEAFPLSNLNVQYMVEKSAQGKMLLKSAETSALLQIVTHRFTQEPKTLAALFALHARWIKNPSDFVVELTAQHSRFIAAEASGKAWAKAARQHVLFVMQQFLEMAPELLVQEAFWNAIRKSSRSWQKECPADDGSEERKFRKWLKATHRRVSTSAAAVDRELQNIDEEVHLMHLQQQQSASNSGGGGGGNSNSSGTLSSSSSAPLTSSSGHQAPMSPHEHNLAFHTMQFLRDVDFKTCAEQISLLESVYFRAIPKSELLLCELLSGNDVERVAPNFFRIIHSFNTLSQWVVSVILTTQLPSQRGELIVYFLKVADHLQNVLTNYNSAYALISALSDPAVERLKNTWTRMSPEFVDLHKRLQEFWSVSFNFRTYRDALQKARDLPPGIPYAGLLSKDLFAIEEHSQSNYVQSPSGGSDQVNVEKIRLLWDKMEAFERLQWTSEYAKVTPNARVRTFLLSLGVMKQYHFVDKATYRSLSLTLEGKKV